MNTKEYLLDLINRMLDDTFEYVHEEEASYYIVRDKANLEAEKLNNTSYIHPLNELIERHSSNKRKDKDIRSKVYSILENIALNTGNSEIYDYFADRLSRETDKDLLGDTLLLYLNRSNYLPNISKILPLVDDNRWLVKYEIIKMLGKYPKEQVEDILLTKLNQSNDTYEIGYLLSSLREIRSSKVISAIDKFLYHDKGEVRASAIATISYIEGERFISTFIDGLKDRSRDVKLNSLHALIEHGKENVIDVLIDYLKRILKSKRKLEPAFAKDSDVVKILSFLIRFRNNKDVISTINWIQNKKWEYLFENEKEWIKENLES